jgi:apolipoprotein D and lipocalin family protein
MQISLLFLYSIATTLFTVSSIGIGTSNKNNTSDTNNTYSYVDYVDLDAYKGYWYEVYKDLYDETFQKDGSCVTANYTIWNNGKVGIVNSELLRNGELSIIDGYAYYKDGNSGGELTVKLDGVDFDAPYWIVELGPIYEDKYDYAIVSDNLKFTLFVLARDVDRFFKQYDSQVLDSIDNMGFNRTYNSPTRTNQSSDCVYI